MSGSLLKQISARISCFTFPFKSRSAGWFSFFYPGARALTASKWRKKKKLRIKMPSPYTQNSLGYLEKKRTKKKERLLWRSSPEYLCGYLKKRAQQTTDNIFTFGVKVSCTYRCINVQEFKRLGHTDSRSLFLCPRAMNEQSRGDGGSQRANAAHARCQRPRKTINYKSLVISRAYERQRVYALGRRKRCEEAQGGR